MCSILLKESSNQQTIEDLIRNTQTIDKCLSAVNKTMLEFSYGGGHNL